MNTHARTAGAALVTAGVLVGGGFAAVGVGSAAPASTSHTISFVTHTLKDVQRGHWDLEASKDAHNGKIVGTDVTNCHFHFSTSSATCRAAIAHVGGMIYAKFVFHPDAREVTGKVTGGTDAYRGATGTMTAKPRKDGTTKVVLTFTT
jgi:hypothetical protein